MAGAHGYRRTLASPDDGAFLQHDVQRPECTFVLGDVGIGAEEPITFIQMSADVGRHRDGIRFANGQEILLQRLAEGQRARVLSVSLEEASAERADQVA